MKFEYHKAIVYLFEKILPTIKTDEKIDVYSKKSRCIHCCNFDGTDEKETSLLQICLEKQKDEVDEIWVLKIEESCSRCNSFEKETVELNYITRDADYEIYHPTRFEKEHVLKEKCKKCGSNLYYRASGRAGSGSSHNFCKKCGFSGMSTFWD